MQSADGLPAAVRQQEDRAVRGPDVREGRVLVEHFPAAELQDEASAREPLNLSETNRVST